MRDTPPDLKRRASLARLGSLFAAASLPLVGCGSGDDAPAPNMPGGPVPPGPPSGGGGGGGGGTPPAPPAGAPRTVLLNDTLNDPWGFAFLPNGQIVVTERAGAIKVLAADGRSTVSTIVNPPTVNTGGQGGLLDVAIDPDYTQAGSNWIYFSYSESGTGGVGTAVNRAKLDLANNMLVEVSTTPLYRQTPKVSGGNHYGSRLVFGNDKTLFITLGERDQDGGGTTTLAQNLTNSLGKVVRITKDGPVPTDNPVIAAGARPELYSYGHRNPQGAALHPTTGELWVAEHGPQGGDEINRIQPGRNYGWPVISWGQQYGTTNQFGQGTSAAGMEQPASYWITTDDSAWTPGTQKSSTAPAGMTFYDGAGFPEWQGNLFVGALRGQRLWRLVLNGNTVVSRESLFASLGQRIRAVHQGPDGWLYFITTSGRLYRVDRA